MYILCNGRQEERRPTFSVGLDGGSSAQCYCLRPRLHNGRPDRRRFTDIPTLSTATTRSLYERPHLPAFLHSGLTCASVCLTSRALVSSSSSAGRKQMIPQHMGPKPNTIPSSSSPVWDTKKGGFIKEQRKGGMQFHSWWPSALPVPGGNVAPETR